MVQIVDFEPQHAAVFKALNEAWITKFFEIEEEDTIALNNPLQIIQKGGFILIALHNGAAVGVCALKNCGNAKYEVSKFAVDDTKQGLGIGKAIMTSLIAKAKDIGAKLLYLEGNTKLGSSIHLYRKFGFKEMNLADYQLAYARVNIIMELTLT